MAKSAQAAYWGHLHMREKQTCFEEAIGLWGLLALPNPKTAHCLLILLWFSSLLCQTRLGELGREDDQPQRLHVG